MSQGRTGKNLAKKMLPRPGRVELSLSSTLPFHHIHSFAAKV